MNRTNLEARLGVRERPEAPAVMYQRWRQLLFLHWVCDAKALQKTLPAGLAVDTYRGEAYLGITPFFMRDVRPRFCPAVPGLSDFLELNVRTYVIDEAGVPGIWFYSLTCNSWSAMQLARRLYCLPYETASMKAKVTAAEHGDSVRFEVASQFGPRRFQYTQTSSCKVAEPESLEFFLVERYVLFAWCREKRRLYSARVHHSPYPLCPVELTDWSAAPLRDSGVEPLSDAPVHRVMSPGVDVEIFQPEQR